MVRNLEPNIIYIWSKNLRAINGSVVSNICWGITSALWKSKIGLFFQIWKDLLTHICLVDALQNLKDFKVLKYVKALTKKCNYITEDLWGRIQGRLRGEGHLVRAQADRWHGGSGDYYFYFLDCTGQSHKTVFVLSICWLMYILIISRMVNVLTTHRLTYLYRQCLLV